MFIGNKKREISFAIPMLYLALAGMLAGCASLTRWGQTYQYAEKMYNAGNFDVAVQKVVEVLREKPAYEPARLLLAKAAPQAYSRHEQAAAGAEQKGNWDEAVKEYEDIIALSSMVRSLPGDYPALDVRSKRDEAAQNAASTHYAKATHLFKEKNFTSAASEFLQAAQYVAGFKNATKNAAESYYQHGKMSMDAMNFKEAALGFKKASGIVSGYKDSQELYEQAKEKAIKRIAVMPFHDPTGKLGGDSISDRVINAAINSQPEFVAFISRENLTPILSEQGLQGSEIVDSATAVKTGKLAGIYSFVFGKVLSVSATSTPAHSPTHQNSKTEKFYNKQTRDFTDSVTYSVQYQTHKIVNTVKLVVSYQIVDVKTGAIQASQTVNTQKSDIASWVTYAGDERAIPPDISVNNRQEPEPLETLQVSAIESVSNDIARKLLAHFD